jgi:hypothetical protein
VTHSAELGRYQFKLGLATLRLSCPAKTEIAGAMVDPFCETVKDCIPVQSFNCLSLSAVEIPRFIFGAEVSEKLGLRLSKLWKDGIHNVSRVVC